MQLNFNPFSTPTVFVTVGLPYSGKSTYIKKDNVLRKLQIVDTDSFIENRAKMMGKTYQDVFKKTIGSASDRMKVMLDLYYRFKQSFIIDQTNLSVEKRERLIKQAKENNYKVVALVFEKAPNDDELEKRVKMRSDKKIPMNVIKQMSEKFVRPTKAEGFDEIISINSWKA